MGPGGFEPPTTSTPSWHDTKLHYGPELLEKARPKLTTILFYSL